MSRLASSCNGEHFDENKSKNYVFFFFRVLFSSSSSTLGAGLLWESCAGALSPGFFCLRI